MLVSTGRPALGLADGRAERERQRRGLSSFSSAFLAAVAGLGAAFLHLGRPSNAWRALGNLRSSWLSREIFFASAFTAALGASALFSLVKGSSVVLDRLHGGARRGLRRSPSSGAWRWPIASGPSQRGTAGRRTAAFFASTLGLGDALGRRAPRRLRRSSGPPRSLPGSPRRRGAPLPPRRGGADADLAPPSLLGRPGRASEPPTHRRGAKASPAARFTLSALVLAAGLAALFGPDPAWPLAAAAVLAFGAEAAGRSLFYDGRVRVGL